MAKVCHPNPMGNLSNFFQNALRVRIAVQTQFLIPWIVGQLRYIGLSRLGHEDECLNRGLTQQSQNQWLEVLLRSL